MELSVYRQATKQRPDGTIVYKGEDALPFVGSTLFMVADGLGGAASIRHQNIVPELFDREKLMNTLFNGVYDDYSDERFVKYVMDSFFELFAVKDCYKENINNIKKSGYFASRIVTAIILHEMIYNNSLKPSILFNEYHSQPTQDKKDEFLCKLGDFFAKTIKEKMREIAKNANLIYESSYSGLALLGSTLCATIFRDTALDVESIYLTAGDSRPYVWTENDGLCQIIEDQEGEDGGMTNYIKANDDEDFGIRCNYMRLDNPCILFNASDGCFDSGFFLSPMAFETLILKRAVEANNATEMGRLLHDDFQNLGKHDDSSTIAMKMFGFDSFTALQDSAKRRLQALNNEYFSKMPDLLDRDYIGELQKSEAIFPGLLSELKTRFENEDDVKAFCGEQIKRGKSLSYESKIRSIDERIAEKKNNREEALKQIHNIASKNNINLQPIIELFGIMNSSNRINSMADRYKQQPENSVESKEDECCGRTETVLSSNIDTVDLKKAVALDDYKLLLQELTIIHDASQEISFLEGDERLKVFEECIKEFWEKNYATIIKEIASNPDSNISENLRCEANRIINSANDTIIEISNKAKLQSVLFHKYEISYERFLGGTV